MTPQLKSTERVQGISIKQRKEDSHYETCIWQNGLPNAFGIGYSQMEADTKCLAAYLDGKWTEQNIKVIGSI